MVSLSLPRCLTRLTGPHLSLARLRQLTSDAIQALVAFPEQGRAGAGSLTVLQCLEYELRALEQTVR